MSSPHSNMKKNQNGGYFVNGKALPVEFRREIVERYDKGETVVQIARSMKATHGVVSKITRYYKKTGSYLPRSSRSYRISAQDLKPSTSQSSSTSNNTSTETPTTNQSNSGKSTVAKPKPITTPTPTAPTHPKTQYPPIPIPMNVAMPPVMPTVLLMADPMIQLLQATQMVQLLQLQMLNRL